MGEKGSEPLTTESGKNEVIKNGKLIGKEPTQQRAKVKTKRISSRTRGRKRHAPSKPEQQQEGPATISNHPETQEDVQLLDVLGEIQIEEKKIEVEISKEGRKRRKGAYGKHEEQRVISQEKALDIEEKGKALKKKSSSPGNLWIRSSQRYLHLQLVMSLGFL